MTSFRYIIHIPVHFAANVPRMSMFLPYAWLCGEAQQSDFQMLKLFYIQHELGIQEKLDTTCK